MGIALAPSFRSHGPSWALQHACTHAAQAICLWSSRQSTRPRPSPPSLAAERSRRRISQRTTRLFERRWQERRHGAPHGAQSGGGMAAPRGHQRGGRAAPGRPGRLRARNRLRPHPGAACCAGSCLDPPDSEEGGSRIGSSLPSCRSDARTTSVAATGRPARQSWPRPRSPECEDGLMRLNGCFGRHKRGQPMWVCPSTAS
ncbi:hypothetical protein B0T25DRAFT_292491 [Lasiosphaeria hispida]|uniref:Uncharacterized protein n=1 Tax=Lasiosphaeria hispida TaxID=260671 RepID=A0AAJ0MB59_9PEZI|nr:hypothetical protein B0T25DRAFT_292491 [Lasiosphaeria hispida]